MSRENVGDALDFIADVFEPIMNIASNAKVKEAVKRTENDREGFGSGDKGRRD